MEEMVLTLARSMMGVSRPTQEMKTNLARLLVTADLFSTPITSIRANWHYSLCIPFVHYLLRIKMLDALVVATFTERVHHELSKTLNITYDPTQSEFSKDPLPAGEIIIIEDLLISFRFCDFRAIGHYIKSKDRQVKKKCEISQLFNVQADLRHAVILAFEYSVVQQIRQGFLYQYFE